MAVHSKTEQSGVYRQIVQVDAHTLYADVKPELGGQGSAPGPHEYFDTALATCKALTAAIYARNHKMALDRVEAHVERDATREREGVYRLKVRLQFFGGLSAAEKQKIHRAVERCPIHKLMTTTTVEIETAPLDPADLLEGPP